MFETSIAGSLPKPAWLAETQKLWPQWKSAGEELQQAKADATLLWIKAQEDAGLDIVGDGEQARQHFVHGFVEHVGGIDFEHKVTMGIRNNRYDAQVPQVVGALGLKGRVHAFEARLFSLGASTASTKPFGRRWIVSPHESGPAAAAPALLRNPGRAAGGRAENQKGLRNPASLSEI